MRGAPLPHHIELRDHGRALHLSWPDGLAAALTAASLRGACRCAACTHLQRAGAPVPVEPGIILREVAEFGVAGLQLVFSDGHRRGIFPWQYLRQLASGGG